MIDTTGSLSPLKTPETTMKDMEDNKSMDPKTATPNVSEIQTEDVPEKVGERFSFFSVAEMLSNLYLSANR